VKCLFHGTPQKQDQTPLLLSVGVLVFAIDEIETIQQHYTHGTERIMAVWFHEIPIQGNASKTM